MLKRLWKSDWPRAKLFEPEGFLEEVLKRARDHHWPESIWRFKVAKSVIQKGLDLTHEEACTLEQSSFGTIFSSEDMREGTRAFLEKRSPEFKGS